MSHSLLEAGSYPRTTGAETPIGATVKYATVSVAPEKELDPKSIAGRTVHCGNVETREVGLLPGLTFVESRGSPDLCNSGDMPLLAASVVCDRWRLFPLGLWRNASPPHAGIPGSCPRTLVVPSGLDFR